MGYPDEQVRELETVINQALVDAVVIGTLIDLRGIADIAHPATRVRRPGRAGPARLPPSSTPSSASASLGRHQGVN